MQEKKDGSSYAPKGNACAVCDPGEFPVGVIGLDHGHIYGMCNGLSEAGANIALVYDPDPDKVAKFRESFPEAKAAASREEVLRSDVKLIACAAVSADRCGIGLEVMEHGKDFFADKPSITTFSQLAAARECTARTGRKFLTYFSERLHVEASVYAEQLLQEGAIGRVVQVMGWGPHRMSPAIRPEWFFDCDRFGGILTDIGCHQIEQIVHFAGASDAKIVQSRMGNYVHKEYPKFQDFGDAMLLCDNGVTGYFRVDWFTPDGLGAWGDGRTLIIGTDGYIEIRKYIDVANSPEGDHVYYVNHEGEHHFCASGKCGFPFFGKLIRDCLDRTETCMKQSYMFRIMELAIEAQTNAMIVEYKE